MITCLTLVAVFFPFALSATSTTPHGYTHLHYHHFHELRTGPLGHVAHNHDDDRAPFLDGTLRVTGLYEQMLSSTAAGRFVGTQPSDGEYTFIHINTAASVAANQADTTNNLFVHADPDGGGNDLTTKLTSKPSYTFYGLQLDYDQYLPILGGWYLGLQMPIVDCRTNLNIAAVDSTQHTPGDLLTYFAGLYYSDTAKRAQEKLTHGIFDTVNRQYSGASQINVGLRKVLWCTSRIQFDTTLHLTIPMISPTKSTHLFAPTLGSNGHWDTGISGHAGFKLWNKYNNSMSINARGFAGYTLGAKEQRTVALHPTLTVAPFGHYALLTSTQATADTALRPAANLLSQNITITPGFHYEATGTLNWRGKELGIELGYTFNGREAESAGSFTWSDDTYAVAGSAYDTSQTFAAQSETENALVSIATAQGGGHTYLQKADLSIDQALLPRITAHQIWATATYATYLGSLPFHLRAGISGNVAGNTWRGRAFSAWASAQLTF